VERLCGAVAAIEQGYMQQMIADEAYEKQRRIASGEDVVVGVNAFEDESAPSPERFDVPPSLEPAQRDRLERLRAGRDGRASAAALARLADVAGGSGDLMPPIVAAVEVDATLGEICSALRVAFGEYRPAGVAI
jgi:methylmalonyl-CoA mutase, N-terminal domain